MILNGKVYHSIKSLGGLIMENNKKINLILDKNTNIVSLLEGEPSNNMISVCHENMRSGLYDMYTHEDRRCKMTIPGMTYCHDTLTLMGIMNIDLALPLCVQDSGCIEFIIYLNKSLHMNSINFKLLEREQKDKEFFRRIFPSNICFMESDSINVTIPYRGIEYNIYMLEEQADKEAYDLSGYGYRETTTKRLKYIKNSPLYKDVENYAKNNMLCKNEHSDIDEEFVLNLLFNMGFDPENLMSLGLDYMINMRDEILSLNNIWEESKYYYLVEDKEGCVTHILVTYIIHLLCHKLYDNSINIIDIFDNYKFDEDLYLIEKSSNSRVSWYEEMHTKILRMMSLIKRCKTSMKNIKIDWTNRLDLEEYIDRIGDPNIMYLESEEDGYIVSGGCPSIYFRKHLGIVNKNINPERYMSVEECRKMVENVLGILYNTDDFTANYLYSLYDIYELDLILRCILYKYIKK